MKNAFASLLRHGVPAVPARSLGAPTVWRLAGCYAVATAAVVLIQRWMPVTATGAWAVPPGLHAAIAMAGAFLISVPVAVVYMRTRTRASYDDSLAITVLVLPTVITAIVIVVQTSLALAFSLAGVVAAVRFRASLKESRDALYIFAVVAIGFSAGVHELDLALVASFIFVLLEVLTWRTDLGAWQPMDTMDPGAAPGGNSAGRHGAHPDGKPRSTTVDPDAEPPPRDVHLRVHVTNVHDGAHAVQPVLDAWTKRWRRLDATESAGRLAVLEYRVRLRRRHPAEELKDRVVRIGQPFVTAVDVTPAESEQESAADE